MHALRQLHELMLCGGAAEHQLALISDAAEITDTYPTPPDEVQPASPSDDDNNNNNNNNNKKACILQIFLFKNGGVNTTKNKRNEYC